MPRRYVFITGASSGIGLAAAQRLDDAGLYVIAGMLPGEDTFALVDTTSNRLMTVPVDITGSESVSDAVETIKRVIGDTGLYGLVNNAGILTVGALETTPLETIERQFAVNVFGHVRVTQAVLPLLRMAGSARIVNVSSILGTMSVPLNGAYSMSKHALEAFTNTLRLELAAQNIDVIAVLPGGVKTPMSDQTPQLADRMWSVVLDSLKPLYQKHFDAMRETWRKQGESGAEPEDIAALIVRALTARRPKTRYLPNDARFVPMLRLLSDRLADRLIRRVIGLKS